MFAFHFLGDKPKYFVNNRLKYKGSSNPDKRANILHELLADVEGVKIQSRGRLAELQGYYCLVFLIDGKKFNNVSLDRLIEVLRAEGLSVGRTYGVVYKHNLWSAPKSSYRVKGCKVAEHLCDNVAICLGHQWLMSDEELMKAIADTFKKVLGLRKELG